MQETSTNLRLICNILSCTHFWTAEVKHGRNQFFTPIRLAIRKGVSDSVEFLVSNFWLEDTPAFTIICNVRILVSFEILYHEVPCCPLFKTFEMLNSYGFLFALDHRTAQ